MIVAASMIASCYTDNWLWFTGSGAWVTIIGVVLTARPLIRMGYSKWRESLNMIDCGSLSPTLEEIEEERQSDQDAKAYIIGLCMSVIGTLILTFGGLLGALLA